MPQPSLLCIWVPCRLSLLYVENSERLSTQIRKRSVAYLFWQVGGSLGFSNLFKEMIRQSCLCIYSGYLGSPNLKFLLGPADGTLSWLLLMYSSPLLEDLFFFPFIHSAKLSFLCSLLEVKVIFYLHWKPQLLLGSFLLTGILSRFH